MDRTTILELAETEVPAAAREFADAIFEPLSRQVNDQVHERIQEWIDSNEFIDAFDDADLERLASAIIHPAFAMHVTDRLSHQLRSSCDGWRNVFWLNMAERYQQTGEV